MIRIQIQCIWIHNTGIESEFILLRNSKYFYGAVAVSSGPGLLPAEPGSVPELPPPPVQPAHHAAHRCQHLPLPSQPGIHNNNINNPVFYDFAKTCANVVQCWGAKITRIFFRLRLHFSFLFWLRLHFSFLFWLPLQQSNSSSTGILPL